MNRFRSFVSSWAGLTLWALLLTLAVYGQAVTFPFLSDDYFQFPFADEHSLLEVWQTAGDLLHFRPLAYSFWKGLKLITGANEPAILHGFNVLLHLINGILVGWLAGRLWSGQPNHPDSKAWARRYLATTLFLLFPFSYQAVAWIAAMMHPLAIMLILLSLITYMKSVDTRHWAWGGLSLLLAFLAPFAHENGALIGPLVIAFEFLRPSARRPLKSRLPRAALWLLPTFLWWLIWRSAQLETIGPRLAKLNPTDIMHSAIYAAQAAAYPITWLGSKLNQWLMLNEFLLVAFLCLLAFSLALYIQSRGSGRMALFPWIWIAVAAAPAVLFMGFQWLDASPRVLMLASVGIALLWTDVLMGLVAWGSSRPRIDGLLTILVLILVVGLLIQNALYIGKQSTMYRLAGRAVQQIVDSTVEAETAGAEAIIVNIPSWLAPPENDYALGEDGVILRAHPAELFGMMSLYTGRPLEITAVRDDSIRQEVAYHVGVSGDGTDWSSRLQERSRVFVARYLADDIEIRPAGALGVDPPGPEPIANFEGQVTLLAAQIREVQGELSLALTWQVNDAVPEDVTVFVHLVDDQGQLVGQSDGEPLAGTYPFWLWPTGTIAQDRRFVQDDNAGDKFLVGLYRRTDGQRLQASSPSGETWSDDAVSIPVPLELK